MAFQLSPTRKKEERAIADFLFYLFILMSTLGNRKQLWAMMCLSFGKKVTHLVILWKSINYCSFLNVAKKILKILCIRQRQTFALNAYSYVVYLF